MSNPIQIPYLRPDPIHEGAGLEQAGNEDQMGQLAKLLMLKGHLALQQEQFQAEEGERKQKKQQLAGLSQGLSQIFAQPGVMDSPGALGGAMGQAGVQFAGAGMGPEAASTIGKMPELQKAQALTNVQKALAGVMNDFKSGNMLDETRQASAYAQTFALDADAGRQFAEGLKSLGGRHTFYTDVTGQHWIGDLVTGKEHKGELGAPRSGAGGAGGAPMTTKEAQVAAGAGVQALVDARNILRQAKDADIIPLLSAGLAGAKTGGGALGAAAGFFQPFAEMAKDPHQQLFGSARDLFKEAYMSVITGKRGVGSPTLQNIVDNAFFPLGGQTDESVRSAKARTRDRILGLLTQLASGKPIDMSQLPGYKEAVREGLGLPIDGSSPPPAPNIPGGLGQPPLGFDDLLNNRVAPVNQKP